MDQIISQKVRKIVEEMRVSGEEFSSIRDELTAKVDEIEDEELRKKEYDGVFVKGVKLWLEENADELEHQGRILHARAQSFEEFAYGVAIIRAAQRLGDALGEL